MAKLTPVKAIRAKCLDCCAGQQTEVRLCPCTDCPLHEYRMGHRPSKTNDFSVEKYVGEEILDELERIQKKPATPILFDDREGDTNDISR